MKKYMLSFMLVATSCALPIMAMEFVANEAIKKNYEDAKNQTFVFNKFKTIYPELMEFSTIIDIKDRNKLSNEKMASAFKKYFDTLIKVAIEDRNYFVPCHDKKNRPIAKNLPHDFLEAANTTLNRLIQELKNNDEDEENENTLNPVVKSLEELRQKGRDAIKKIKALKKEGKYTPNPEYHAQLKPAHGLSLAKYACIAGGIALGAAAIVGIGYWIKKQFFDKNKQKTQSTNKPHIAS